MHCAIQYLFTKSKCITHNVDHTRRKNLQYTSYPRENHDVKRTEGMMTGRSGGGEEGKSEKMELPVQEERGTYRYEMIKNR